MKKIIVIFLLTFVFSSINHVLASVSLNYDDLYKLEIGQTLPTFIPDDPSVEQIKNTDKIIYTVPSTDYSHPHLIHTSPSGVVSFIQLTVPSDKLEATNKYLLSLGVPTVNTAKSQAEIMYAYPANGISFIVNGYSNSVVRIQKYPPTTVDSFNSSYGVNYQSKDASSSPETELPKSNYNLAMILTVLVVLIMIIVKIITHKRSHKYKYS